MKTYEVLEKALALIEDEKNWCQGLQETFSGERCASGAIIAAVSSHNASFEDGRRAAAKLGVIAARHLRCPTEDFEDAIVNFNDFHTHAEVVALFQEAIRREKAKEGVPIDVSLVLSDAKEAVE